jgi:hypothetical protein
MQEEYGCKDDAVTAGQGTRRSNRNERQGQPKTFGEHTEIAVRETKKNGLFTSGHRSSRTVDRKARWAEIRRLARRSKSPRKKVVKFRVAKIVKDAIVTQRKIASRAEAYSKRIIRSQSPSLFHKGGFPFVLIVKWLDLQTSVARAPPSTRIYSVLDLPVGSALEPAARTAYGGGHDRNYHQRSWVFVTLCWLLPCVPGPDAGNPTSRSAAPSSSGTNGVPKVSACHPTPGADHPEHPKSVEEHRIAGAVSLVARHGKIAYLKAFGMANRKTRNPCRPIIFRICSMTKPITSVAVMMLYEEGTSLSDPVSNFIPEFKEMKVLIRLTRRTRRRPQEALLRQASHNDPSLAPPASGLTYHWNARLGGGIAGWVGPRRCSPGRNHWRCSEKAGRPTAAGSARRAWEYGVADDVLGYLVEVVSGMPLNKFLHERLFNPSV